MSLIGKRLNERFLSSYIELDRNCCEKFSVSRGGVTEYINSLNNARYAHGREDALPRLIKYRNIRNRLAHETGSLRKSNDVTKFDVSWIRKFTNDIKKQRDPISKYLKLERKHSLLRKIKSFIVIFLITAAIIIGIITYILLTK